MENLIAVYIITNLHNTVLYVGATRNLKRRVSEHRNKRNAKSFSAQYNVYKLLYFEVFPTFKEALAREKEIKKWRREKKIRLINQINPKWDEIIIR